MVGSGGAVSSVDREASQIGIEVLRKGGNAVDAAVATAAALGVVEPYSAGVGGGGYMVYYDAKAKKVRTIDGRETAPRRPRDSFLDLDRQAPPLEEGVNSGLSVGVPGTPATWETALNSWGTARWQGPAHRPPGSPETASWSTTSSGRRPAEREAVRAIQVHHGALPAGQAPGGRLALPNPDLARTYRELAREGVDALYRGQWARVVRPSRSRRWPRRRAQGPPRPDEDEGSRRRTSPGAGAHAGPYHGLDVYAMAPSSSGGTTVGEALNILENFHLSKADKTQALHHYLEASRDLLRRPQPLGGGPDVLGCAHQAAAPRRNSPRTGPA